MNLKEKYQQEVLPKLKQELGLKNSLAAPKIVKVTLNVGVGKGKDDPKVAETAENTLKRITGQAPVYTKSKKSISAFKVREGMKVGLKVTLRGRRMWDFLDKLVRVTLPRIRDFRGIPQSSFDNSGNYTLGLSEQIVFPEIDYAKVDKVRGFEVTLVTTGKNKENTKKLLTLLGVPFKKA